MKLKKIPSLEQWMKSTDAGRFARRGEDLKAIDALIEKVAKTAEGFPRKNALNLLERAFAEYKRAHILWEDDERNKSGVMSDLDNSLRVWKNHVMPKLPDPLASDIAFGRSGFMQEEHVHSRLGILWLFSSMNIDAEEPVVEPEPDPDPRPWYRKIWDAIVSFCNTVWQSCQSAYSTVKSIGFQAAVGAGVKSAVVSGVSAIKSQPEIAKVLANRRSRLPQAVVMAIKKLIKEKLSIDMAPGLDFAQSVVTAIDGCHSRYEAWKAAKNVKLAEGTPAATVKAITGAMNYSTGTGLFDVLKNALGFIPGPQAIAVKIAGGLVTLHQLIRGWWEKRNLTQFIKEAKVLWDLRTGPSSIHRRAVEFNKWYSDSVSAAPAIAMLTLNTGCCGSKIVWLSMFDSGKLPITAGQFNEGVQYLDAHLMPYSTGYLADRDYALSSKDGVADALIRNAKMYSYVSGTQAAIRMVQTALGGNPASMVQRTFNGLEPA